MPPIFPMRTPCAAEKQLILTSIILCVTSERLPAIAANIPHPPNYSLLVSNDTMTQKVATALAKFHDANFLLIESIAFRARSLFLSISSGVSLCSIDFTNGRGALRQSARNSGKEGGHSRPSRQSIAYLMLSGLSANPPSFLAQTAFTSAMFVSRHMSANREP